MNNRWKHLSKISPQRENGHREIENGVFRALMLANLEASQYKVLFAVIDRTWGFGKHEDVISDSQLMGLTGLSKSSVIRARVKLRKMRMIDFEPSEVVSHGKHLNRYLFNKHYDTWIDGLVSPMTGVMEREKLVSQAKRTGSVHDTYKRNIQKKYTKEKNPPLPPHNALSSGGDRQRPESLAIAIILAWNEVMPGLGYPPVKGVTQFMRLAIDALATDYPQLDVWKQAFQNIRNSKVLNGMDGWKPSLGWLVGKPGTMERVLSGEFSGNKTDDEWAKLIAELSAKEA